MKRTYAVILTLLTVIFSAVFMIMLGYLTFQLKTVLDTNERLKDNKVLETHKQMKYRVLAN